MLGLHQRRLFYLATLKLPEILPLSLPSQLVEQRPDVREYEALLHQGSAGIGVATANMLPQFTLSAGLGDFAGSGISPSALAFSVLTRVTQPIFEGGTLLHRRRAAIAAYDHAGRDLRQALAGERDLVRELSLHFNDMSGRPVGAALPSPAVAGRGTPRPE